MIARGRPPKVKPSAAPLTERPKTLKAESPLAARARLRPLRPYPSTTVLLNTTSTVTLKDPSPVQAFFFFLPLAPVDSSHRVRVAVLMRLPSTSFGGKLSGLSKTPNISSV